MAQITIKDTEIVNLIKKTPLSKYIINLRAQDGNIMGSIKLKKILPGIDFSLGFQSFIEGVLTLKISVGIFAMIGLFFSRRKLDGVILSYPYIKVNTREYLPEFEVQKIVQAGQTYHLYTRLK